MEAPAPPEPAARAVAEGGDAAAAGALAVPNGLAALVRTGLQLLDRFVAASQPGAGAERAGAGGAGPAAVEHVRDEQTDQAYLKIRMPQAEVLERVARSLHALLESVAQ